MKTIEQPLLDDISEECWQNLHSPRCHKWMQLKSDPLFDKILCNLFGKKNLLKGGLFTKRS